MKESHFINTTVLQSRTLQYWSQWNRGHSLDTVPTRERERKSCFPLFNPHIKDFQTYQQGRVWQCSLVPVIDPMLHQAEHGWWNFGDSSLALLVHVLSLAPCLLPSILLGQHQDRVLAHCPEIHEILKSVYLNCNKFRPFYVWHSLAGRNVCPKESNQSRKAYLIAVHYDCLPSNSLVTIQRSS